MLSVLKWFPLILLLAGVPAVADIFTPDAPADSRLRKAVIDDRAFCYYRTPGLDRAQHQVKVSELDKASTGSLLRPVRLEDRELAFRQDLEKGLRPLLSGRLLDKVPASAYDLLRLSYSSPALADIVKHYRTLSMQSLLLEELGLLRLDLPSDNLSERLRKLSVRECLLARQEKGLMQALGECRKIKEPFSFVPRIQDTGTLEDGRRAVHVIRDAVSLLGLQQLNEGDKVAALCGDVVITANDISEVFPKRSFASVLTEARQEFITLWQKAAEDFLIDGKVSEGKLVRLSLAGAPVTDRILAQLDMLPDSVREARVLALSSHLALAEARQVYTRAIHYLEHCLLLPRLPQAYRSIIESKRDVLRHVLVAAREEEYFPAVYKDMLGRLSGSADVVRARLLEDSYKENKRSSSEQSLSESTGLLINF